MSETDSSPVLAPENQQQRWIKYGSNVVLVSVVVVVLALIFGYIAQMPSAKARVDTTQLGLYSLKPQTKAILNELKQNVKLVSLYKVVKPPAGKEKDWVDLSTPVSDLLNEYKRYGGGKVEVDIIDPTQSPAKVDDLISDVSKRYGGEVDQYKGYLNEYTEKIAPDLRKRLLEESKAAPQKEAYQADKSPLAQLLRQAAGANTNVQKSVDALKKDIDRWLEQKPPNYKEAVDGISSNLKELSEELAGPLVEEFSKLKGDTKSSKPVREYVDAATPRWAEMKKIADEFVERGKKLGELKLDDLRKALRAENGILVMGPKAFRVIEQGKVWVLDPNLRKVLRVSEKNLKPQFAGEQQVTSAILSLTQEKKPKVAFVRAGGPPLTTQGMLFGPPPGDLSRIAERLRDYNFEVLEKDLSGMWAMQQQMQQRGMPPEPEPDDAALKDAVWVVIGLPSQPGPMGPPPQIASKVAEHLKAGGAALIVSSIRGEDLSAALADYGIKCRTDAVIVHEPVPEDAGAKGDFLNEARKRAYVFVLNDYGNHMLAQPLRSLDMPLIAGLPVSTEAKPGVKSWNLLPIPTDTSSRVWGETNVEALVSGDAPTFDPAADLKGPLFAGAAAQKEQGDGRVVVIGNYQFAVDEMLAWPDVEVAERTGFGVKRFPGSAELFTNSVFWLAKMEPMIAISPAAMDVSRIAPMSKNGEAFWRFGVLLVGLPLLVVVAGGLMYVRRRD